MEPRVVAGTSSRITVNPAQCGGRPCIRRMRIRVTDVLDLLAAGLTPDQVVEELPDLELEDVRAVLSGIDLRSHGIDANQAREIRESLASFADDWDAPEMDVYDLYDANRRAMALPTDHTR